MLGFQEWHLGFFALFLIVCDTRLWYYMDGGIASIKRSEYGSIVFYRGATVALVDIPDFIC